MNLVGQNLIGNGDFEIIKSETSFKWETIAGTPDYINLSTVSNTQNKFPKNDEHNDKENVGYMGLVFTSRSSEVFHQKLDKKLEKDKLYKLSCSVLAGVFCRSGLENVTISLTSEKLKNSVSPINYNLEVLKLTTEDNLIKHGEWIELKTIFKAVGNEQYVSIGNFNLENSKYIKSSKQLVESGTDSSCHYLTYDNIVLEEYEGHDSTVKLMTEEKSGKTIVIEDVYFESGRSELKHEFQVELDSIFEIIKEVDRSITIIGYTDSVGETEANEILSVSRAESVKAYLVNSGYNASKIATKGLHESNPVMSNETEYGRSKNRRVEIIIENVKDMQ